jgi:hypothetical protein
LLGYLAEEVDATVSHVAALKASMNPNMTGIA